MVSRVGTTLLSALRRSVTAGRRPCSSSAPRPNKDTYDTFKWYQMELYGVSLKDLSHHHYLIPLHCCTVVGVIVATLYSCRLAYNPDCVIFGWRDPRYIAQNENIALIGSGNDCYSKRSPEPFCPTFKGDLYSQEMERRAAAAKLAAEKEAAALAKNANEDNK